ncbi:MAG: hypothetical protein JRJ65_08455 [Deltaproteobacteria bacterium]|nr:hypothetical protein [Deltaproteobacteria bacterium]
MKEAGHTEGVECKLHLFAQVPREFWIAVQRYLNDVGIKVKLNFLNRPAFRGLMFSGVSGNDMRIGNIVDLPDPFLNLTKYAPGAVFYSELKRPPEFLRLLKQVTVEKEVGKQTAMLEQMEELAYNNVIYIPLWNTPLMRAIDPKLRDYIGYFHNMNEFRLERAWFEKN